MPGGPAAGTIVPMRTKAGLLVLALAVLAADGYVLSQRNATTTVALDDVVAEFRTGSTVTPPPPAVDPVGGAADPAAAAVAVADPTTAPPADAAPAPAAPDPAPAVEPAPVEPVAPAPVEPAAPQAYRLPEEGVYTYSAQGGESISLLGSRHAYGPDAYATVRHTGGCSWEHRLTVIAEHVDTRVLCSQPGGYLQLAQDRQITFFGQTQGSAMACDPAQLHHGPGEAPGATGTAACAGSGGYDGSLTRTFRGTEAIDIGGTVVEAVRVDIDAVLSGRSVGQSHDQLWLHPETGLTLRWDRTVDTVADAVFGAQVRYQEQASFVLRSLVPQR